MKRVVEKFLELVCIVLLASLSLVVLVGVAYRIGGASLVWYDEVASILLAWLTYWGSSLAALKRAHIGFPGIVKTLPAAQQRVLLVVSEIVVFGFFILLAWVGWQVFEILEGDTLVSLPDVPAQWAQVIIPLGAVLFIVAEALALPALWRETGRATPPPAPAVTTRDVLSTE